MFGDDSFRLHPVRRHFEVCSSVAMIHFPLRFEFHALRGLLSTRYLGFYTMGHSGELLMLFASCRLRHYKECPDADDNLSLLYHSQRLNEKLPPSGSRMQIS